jgi:hypothetical protein
MEHYQPEIAVPNSALQYDSGLEVVPSTKEPVLISTLDTTSKYPQGDVGILENVPNLQQYPEQQRLICGFRRTTFWLVVALVLVLIIGAVGGGVGGSIAAKKSNVK